MKENLIRILSKIRLKLGWMYFKYISMPIWRAKGFREIRVFGETYRFVPGQNMLDNEQLWPINSALENIVNYTDYVQMRSLAREIEVMSMNPVLIEVGAFDGVYAVVLGKLIQKKQGKVIAIEPNPEHFSLMLENIRLNNLEDTIVCENCAVSDHAGKAFINLSGSTSTLINQSESCSIEVEVTTVSEIIKKHSVNSISILLIDVEGAELPVLKGVPWEKVDQTTKIYCEMHPYAWKEFGYGSLEMGGFIREQNYRCFDMYLQEHLEFSEDLYYIGPTLLVRA